MSEAFSLRAPFFRATLVGSVAQLVMVLAGHWILSVANLFGLLGVTISFLAGVLFGRWASPIPRREALTGGAAVGAISAFVGILISFGLGDVPAVILAFGTVSSAVTGMIGGWAGGASSRRALAA